VKDKEPEQGRILSFSITLTIICMVAVPAYMRAPDTHLYGWLDYTAIVGFCLLLAWLTSDSPRRPESGADNSFALRLGKALNRTLKRLKRLFGASRAD
jgi:hypothetical protein